MLPIFPDVLLLCTPLADELIALTGTATSTAKLQRPAALSACWDRHKCEDSRAMMSSCAGGASDELAKHGSMRPWRRGLGPRIALRHSVTPIHSIIHACRIVKLSDTDDACRVSTHRLQGALPRFGIAAALQKCEDVLIVLFASLSCLYHCSSLKCRYCSQVPLVHRSSADRLIQHTIPTLQGNVHLKMLKIAATYQLRTLLNTSNSPGAGTNRRMGLMYQITDCMLHRLPTML